MTMDAVTRTATLQGSAFEPLAADFYGGSLRHIVSHVPASAVAKSGDDAGRHPDMSSAVRSTTPSAAGPGLSEDEAPSDGGTGKVCREATIQCTWLLSLPCHSMAVSGHSMTMPGLWY